MTINIIMVTALPMPPKRKNLMGRENLFSGEKATNANTVMSAKNGAKNDTKPDDVKAEVSSRPSNA